MTSTILKLLQIMTEKRLVVRDEAARTHIYAAALTQAQTQRQLVTDLLERAFDGSAAKLVLQALAAGRALRSPASPRRCCVSRGGARQAPAPSSRARASWRCSPPLPPPRD